MATDSSPDSPTTTGRSQSPTLRYWTDTTEGSTLESPKLRWWTEQQLADATRVLNPCAGTAHLDIDAEVVRVDIDPEADADLHIDFRELLDYVDPSSFDGICYDPPYSYNQAVTKYGVDLDPDEFYYYDAEVKQLFDRLLEPAGVFVQFGYTTAAMPRELGYELQEISLFNKLGSQNDYFGTAVRKPSDAGSRWSPIRAATATRPNADADRVTGGNVTVDGNGGRNINVRYHAAGSTTSHREACTDMAATWIPQSDRLLHIYAESPQLGPFPAATTCSYRAPDLDLSPDDTADVITEPWNINAEFAEGAFDAVILDLPYRAFQQNIRVPWKQGSASQSAKTHVDTAIKRSITDLVRGNGGRVIQIGKTATLMSGNDYDYYRDGVGIIQHPTTATDTIIVADAKPHDNLGLSGIPDGPVDAYNVDPTTITDKESRTAVTPTGDTYFCPYCGNSYYRHPAAYVTCFTCGAAPQTMCVDESGRPRSEYHTERIDHAEEIHDGSCNNTPKTDLSPASDSSPTSSDPDPVATALSDFN